MKFGEHLKESIAEEYGPDPYLDYGKLDVIIRDLSEKAPARYVLKMGRRATRHGIARSCCYASVYIIVMYCAVFFLNNSLILYIPYPSSLAILLVPT